MIGVRGLLRLLAAAPAAAVTAGVALACGGIGAAFPGAFLAEPHGPGLIAAALLGLCGAGVGGLLWAALLAAWIAGEAFTPYRIALHASGQGQLRSRSAELATLLALVACFDVIGAVGGVVSTLAQAPPVRGGLELAPSLTSFVLCIGIGIASAIVGWVLAVAIGRTAVAVAIHLGVLAFAILLRVAAYFFPHLGPVASVVPFGPLVDGATATAYARRIGSESAVAVVAIAAQVAWAAALAAVGARRARRMVA